MVQPAFSNKLRVQNQSLSDNFSSSVTFYSYESIGNEVAKIYQSMMESEDWRDCKQIDFLESHDFMLKVSSVVPSSSRLNFDSVIIRLCSSHFVSSQNVVSGLTLPGMLFQVRRN